MQQQEVESEGAEAGEQEGRLAKCTATRVGVVECRLGQQEWEGGLSTSGLGESAGTAMVGQACSNKQAGRSGCD